MIQGNGAVPETLNRYGYCWGNPVIYIDRDGLYPTTQEEWEAIAPYICHSYWSTTEGLWSSQRELPLNSPKLRMSEKGKELIKDYELGDKKTSFNQNIVVANEITNKIEAVYPYYVGDGGITLGYGHYISFEEAQSDSEEMALLQKYINFGEAITSDDFDDGEGMIKKPRIVPNSTPIPIEELEKIFEMDVEKMTTGMLGNFDDKTLCLTIQQLDALILYRFQHGTLGAEITELVENGASREEWDKVINDDSTKRHQDVKKIYWGNVFDYDECMQEN